MKEIVLFGNSKSLYNISLMRELSGKEFITSCFDIAEIIDKRLKRKIPSVFRRIYALLILPFLFSKYAKKDKEKRIAHIQSVSLEKLFFLPFLKRRFNFIVITFWGSDLLRQSKKRLSLLLPLFKAAKKITLETEEMKTIFLAYFPFLEKKVVEGIRFGLPVLDKIDRTTDIDTDLFCKKYLIPKDKKVIILGINKKEAQQHIPVIKSMSGLSNKDDYIILIPWSYGLCAEGYYESVLYEIQHTGISYRFMFEYLNEENMACLRKITDLLIQVQTTDSLSGSMLETLYSEKPVITGKWLPYEFLDEKGVFIYKVDAPEDVGLIVDNVLKMYTDNKDNFSKNREIISRLSKWSSCIEDWVNLYC